METFKNKKKKLIHFKNLLIHRSEVAQHLERDSYALIFGFNLFVALGLGSILTYTVIEGNLIYFTTRQQVRVKIIFVLRKKNKRGS